MAIEFVIDRYSWDPDGRRFLLVEPPAVFDDPPDRVAVQAWRVREGWQLLYTPELTPRPNTRLIDLWSRSQVDN